MNLAHAMRIFRPPNNKYAYSIFIGTSEHTLIVVHRFLGLLYDGEAVRFSADVSRDATESIKRDAFDGDGFLLNPLKYNEEASVLTPLPAMRSSTQHLCSALGKLPRLLVRLKVFEIWLLTVRTRATHSKRY